MILSRDRDEDDMIVQCPNCKRMMIRKGRLIKSSKSLTCEGCGNEIRLTYSYKMAIFENRRPPS
jgi:DNA-directed RNA polymerase subunit M/transcription elongation factor TFIIS